MIKRQPKISAGLFTVWEIGQLHHFILNAAIKISAEREKFHTSLIILFDNFSQKLFSFFPGACRINCNELCNYHSCNWLLAADLNSILVSEPEISPLPPKLKSQKAAERRSLLCSWRSHLLSACLDGLSQPVRK